MAAAAIFQPQGQHESAVAVIVVLPSFLAKNRFFEDLFFFFFFFFFSFSSLKG